MSSDIGFLLYNGGRGCNLRTIVCLYSLRKVYFGKICLFSPKNDEPECKNITKKIAEFYGCDYRDIDVGVPNGKNKIFLERTLYHTVTPYDISISLDSDTVVLKPDILQYAEWADKRGFCLAQFADWTSHGGVIRKRIKHWDTLYPDYIEDAINFGPAINCGCFAFSKLSRVMKDWYNLALPGRDGFIADETCMQMMLPRYVEHLMILPSHYNTSCKYDSTIDIPDRAVMIHFHGKKHCRMDKKTREPIFNSHIWLNEFKEIYQSGDFNFMIEDPLMTNSFDKMFERNKKHIIQWMNIR